MNYSLLRTDLHSSSSIAGYKQGKVYRVQNRFIYYDSGTQFIYANCSISIIFI